MNEEKLIKEILKDLTHPIMKEEIDDNLYSDMQNDLGDDKPKYLDSRYQRTPWKYWSFLYLSLFYEIHVDILTKK